MCLIVYQPMGDSPIETDKLTNAWSANRDGAGYMYVHNGKLVIRKPFYKLKELIAAYIADHTAFGATSPFVIHFRWATHGTKDAENVHPHALAGGKVGLVHNGILKQFNPGWEADISDTVFFCRTVLFGRQASQLMGKRFNKILAEIIRDSNKLVLLDNAGNVSIVNDKAGIWDGGRWYSNASYERDTMCGFSATTTCSNAVLPPASNGSVARGFHYGRNALPAAYGGRGDEWDAESRNYYTHPSLFADEVDDEETFRRMCDAEDAEDEAYDRAAEEELDRAYQAGALTDDQYADAIDGLWFAHDAAREERRADRAMNAAMARDGR